MVALRDFEAEALCLEFDYSTLPDHAGVFYPWFGREGTNQNRGETDGERQEREAIARSICSPCPVRLQCLEYQMERESSSLAAGFFGGMTEDERKILHRQRREMAEA
jgi:hypothetical protein